MIQKCCERSKLDLKIVEQKVIVKKKKTKVPAVELFVAVSLSYLQNYLCKYLWRDDVEKKNMISILLDFKMYL